MLDIDDVIHRVIRKAAANLGCDEDKIACRMGRTNWGSVQGLYEREFAGSYRGYYPKVASFQPDEATLGEVFDLLAAELGDPRRALRSPAPQTGARDSSCDDTGDR